MTDPDRVEPEAFVWRQGRNEVKLTRDGDGWCVCLTATSRLRGPRQVLYHARHTQATHAAWDVMARVIRACRDEEEGIRVGRSAARWRRLHGGAELHHD